MLLAQGILTARGGVSSHAALVARQLGKVCVCGASELSINYGARTLTAGGVTLKEGEYLSIDGTTGEIYAGMIETTDSEVQRVLSGALAPEKSATFGLYETVMGWADKARRMKIHQRRYPGHGQGGHRLRGRGHRSMPHGTHVLRGEPH